VDIAYFSPTEKQKSYAQAAQDQREISVRSEMRQAKAATLSRRKDPLWETLHGLQTISRHESALPLWSKRPTSNAQRPTPNRRNVAGLLCKTPLLGKCLRQTLYNYFPPAMRFSATFTSSSADLPSPFCCKSYTTLCASTCL